MDGSSKARTQPRTHRYRPGLSSISKRLTCMMEGRAGFPSFILNTDNVSAWMLNNRWGRGRWTCVSTRQEDVSPD
eukprot:1160636-Pelagomonas_calceolata.AAC.11